MSITVKGFVSAVLLVIKEMSEYKIVIVSKTTKQEGQELNTTQIEVVFTANSKEIKILVDSERNMTWTAYPNVIKNLSCDSCGYGDIIDILDYVYITSECEKDALLQEQKKWNALRENDLVRECYSCGKDIDLTNEEDYAYEDVSCYFGGGDQYAHNKEPCVDSNGDIVCKCSYC